MLSAQQMESLPDFFVNIPDHRRAQGKRHKLATVLAIATAATLCGMRGYPHQSQRRTQRCTENETTHTQRPSSLRLLEDDEKLLLRHKLKFSAH
jgi:hypothetical protein